MLIDQQTFDSIRKLKQHELRLPVHRGRLPRKGSAKAHGTDAKGGKTLRRCPYRKGGVYTLKPRVPYDRHRQRAEQQPTRARAVLVLIGLCDQPTKSLTITVLDVTRQDDKWLIRFEKGNHQDKLDSPVFLAKYGDYTMTPSKQAVRGDPEVMSLFAADLEAARRRALEKRVNPQQQALNRIRADTDTLLAAMTAMKDRNRLKLIRREIDKLTAKLSVEESAMLSASSCAERQWPVAVEDGPRPNSTKPPVSLEPAA